MMAQPMFGKQHETPAALLVEANREAAIVLAVVAVDDDN
jgi:hypothetical protein